METRQLLRQPLSFLSVFPSSAQVSDPCLAVMPTDARKIFSFTLALSVVDFQSGQSWSNVERASASRASRSRSALPTHSIVEPRCLDAVAVSSPSPPTQTSSSLPASPFVLLRMTARLASLGTKLLVGLHLALLWCMRIPLWDLHSSSWCGRRGSSSSWWSPASSTSCFLPRETSVATLPSVSVAPSTCAAGSWSDGRASPGSVPCIFSATSSNPAHSTWCHLSSGGAPPSSC